MAAITRMEVVEGDSVAVCGAILRYTQKAADRTGELNGSKEEKITPSFWLERLHSCWNDLSVFGRSVGGIRLESRNSRAQE